MSIEVHRDAGFEHGPLRARRLGVHSQQEALVFMRTDCHVCRAEALTSHSRLLLSDAAYADLVAIASRVVATNAVPHSSNGVDLAPLVSALVQDVLGSMVAVSTG